MRPNLALCPVNFAGDGGQFKCGVSDNLGIYKRHLANCTNNPHNKIIQTVHTVRLSSIYFRGL